MDIKFFIASNLWEHHKYFGECVIMTDILLICSSLHEICSVTGFSKAFLGNDIENIGSICFSETYDVCVCVCTSIRMCVYICVSACTHGCVYVNMYVGECILMWGHTHMPTSRYSFPTCYFDTGYLIGLRSQSRVSSLPVSARDPLVLASQH